MAKKPFVRLVERREVNWPELPTDLAEFVSEMFCQPFTTVRSALTVGVACHVAFTPLS